MRLKTPSDESSGLPNDPSGHKLHHRLAEELERATDISRECDQSEGLAQLVTACRLRKREMRPHAIDPPRGHTSL